MIPEFHHLTYRHGPHTHVLRVGHVTITCHKCMDIPPFEPYGDGYNVIRPGLDMFHVSERGVEEIGMVGEYPESL